MRENFDLEPGVHYLDAASITPRARAAADAARVAIERSEQPWKHRAWSKALLAQEVRTLAAGVLGASDGELAITSSVSYGMATAAANISVPRGSRIVGLEDDHPSAALIWQRVAAERGAVYEAVPKPADADWTTAVRNHLDAGAPVSVAVLPPVHWTDGGLIDLGVLAPLVRAHGSALVVDATQAAGMLDVDAHGLDADFIAFPSYKWMMGPYGLAFLYVHQRHHEGVPIEEHMGARKAPALKEAGTPGDLSFKPGAERFDRGERDDGILLSIAREGFLLSTSVARAQKQSHAWHLNDRLVAGLAGMPVTLAPKTLRAPHILGLQLASGLSAARVAEALELHRVFVSPRRGFIRVAPYLYNDEADVDGFLAALKAVLTS